MWRKNEKAKNVCVLQNASHLMVNEMGKMIKPWIGKRESLKLRDSRQKEQKNEKTKKSTESSHLAGITCVSRDNKRAEAVKLPIKFCMQRGKHTACTAHSTLAAVCGVCIGNLYVRSEQQQRKSAKSEKYGQQNMPKPINELPCISAVSFGFCSQFQTCVCVCVCGYLESWLRQRQQPYKMRDCKCDLRWIGNRSQHLFCMLFRPPFSFSFHSRAPH